MSDTVDMKVLWLRPSTGENVSVRRERIAEHLEAMGVDVTICDASGLDAFSAAKEAVTGDYDIIAGNVRMGLYLGYPLARLLRKPFLGDVSDPITDISDLPDPLYRLLRRYEWFTLRRADAAVFVHEETYREAKRRGIDAVHLPNAVDYDTFANPSEGIREDVRRILKQADIDPKAPIAIYAGILDEVHHITDIVDAAAETPDWEFVFIGEGPLEARLDEAGETFDNVHYLGSFEHRLVPGFLWHADVGFCFKDAQETLKLKEYGAAGLPAIVQPGALSERYDEDELVFVEPDREKISETLKRLRKKELRESYAESGRAIAREGSWKEIAEEYRRLFEERLIH